MLINYRHKFKEIVNGAQKGRTKNDYISRGKHDLFS